MHDRLAGNYVHEILELLCIVIVVCCRFFAELLLLTEYFDRVV